MRKYEDSLPLKLLRAREVAMGFFRPMLQEHSITEQQWRVMRVLNDIDEIEAKQLADKCCILSPSLTGIIQRLEQQNYVSRRKSPKDHRRILVRITPKARKLLNKMTPMIEENYARLTRSLSLEKTEQLKALLDELSQITP